VLEVLAGCAAVCLCCSQSCYCTIPSRVFLSKGCSVRTVTVLHVLYLLLRVLCTDDFTTHAERQGDASPKQAAALLGQTRSCPTVLIRIEKGGTRVEEGHGENRELWI
jgi:hypothetical protein